MAENKVVETKNPSKFRGTWMPQNTEETRKWWSGFVEDVERKVDMTKVHPVIEEFRELIETDPVVRMYCTEMIEQIPPNPVYDDHRIKDVDHMLMLLNGVLTRAPEYNDTLLVGTPMSAIIVWTMGTPAGFAAYRNEKINGIFKKMLDVWCNFLCSEDSRYVLNSGPTGWKCEAAREKLHMENYQYDENDEYWGFKSWNDFFTRRLAANARPIADPDNHKVITSGCDCTIYKISDNVKKFDKFWIKEQPYSLYDMLGDAKDEVDQFVGGTVYQAFLNPFNYHRWHSPISGTIKKAFVQDGLYFSQTDCEGEDPNDQDASEGYLSQVQTRAIYFIECDDPAIGMVCMMPIGMVEISSCIIDDKMKPGYHVTKGEEIGYFQFGGSTHCMIFRKGVIDHFEKTSGSVRMGEPIAVAK